MATMDITRKLQSLHYPLNSGAKNIIPELLKPFRYFTSVPGKKIRQNLIHVLAYWIPIAQDIVPRIDELVQYIHNASLLIDDIQDASDLRRGVPTAHTIYGIPRTIYAVNYIQCCVYDMLDGINNLEYHNSKGFCEDITEGKFSFPIAHAINNFPKEGKEIMNILCERTYDVQLKKQCLSILEKCGSFEYTKTVLAEPRKTIHEEVAKLDENPLIYDYIEKAMLVGV